MRRAATFLCSVAAAAIALVAPVPAPDISPYPSAEAASNISISIRIFYDGLAPYGSWVNYDGSYVFVPTRVGYGWRPYTIGHWEYTFEYGWMWVSDEPFGWATYHYGRWGYSDAFGWYWLPGRRWAPAWVGWRRGHGYVVWCPLSPRYDDDFSVAIVISDIPDYYWIAVPSRSFLSINLSANIIEDDRERVRVVHETEPVGNVTIENDVVVDKVIDVDSIEKETKQHVRPVRVKQTADPQVAGKGGQGSVAVFTGDVRQTNAEPADVKDIEVVKKIKGNHKKEEAIGSAESATPEMRGSTGEVQGSEGGKKMKKPGTQEQMTVPEEGQTQPGEQPAQKKKKASTEQQMQPEEMQTQGGERPAQKKKKASTEQQMQLQGEEQPVKKKRKAQEQQAEPMQNAQEPVQMKKARKEKAPAGQCDPATGCPQ